MTLADHLCRVIARSKAFCRATEPGHFMVIVWVPAEAPAVPPLNEFDLDHELGRWLDCKLAAARPGWRATEGIDDDSLPSICPQFGIAEHTAWLGQEVLLQRDTCLPRPLVQCPEDIDRLVLSRETPWFRYMKEGYEHLRRGQDGTFFLSVRGVMMPMDAANALRGDDLYMDMLAEKDFAHKLMAWLTRAIPWYYNQLLGWADQIEGGYIFRATCSWMGGKVLGTTSNDAAMLCSSDVYEEFGFPYEQQLLGGYEGCIYHVHNEKIHYVPRLAQLPKLSLLTIARDPKTPALLEDVPRLLAHTGNANLMLSGSSDQVRGHIEELKSRNVFLSVACRDRKDAEDVVEFVRGHSRPLVR